MFLEWLRGLRKEAAPAHRHTVSRKQSRYTYTDGPMTFLAQQVVREMQRMGWPATIHCVLRPEEEQWRVYSEGFSRAKPFESPHQYYEAADIVHKSLFWNAPKAFWDALEDAAKIVSDRYGVAITGGFDWGWDYAHIEIEDWREFRDQIGKRHPTSSELSLRFQAVLPAQWKQFQRSAAANGKG